MNNVLKEAIWVLILTYGFSPALHSQTNNPKFLFGVGAGTFIYQGDLTPSSLGSYRTMKPVINFFAAKFFNPFLSLRANLAFGGLRGDDAKYSNPAYRQQRNFNFRTPVAEVSAIAEWNILGRNYISKGFSPYLFAGAGYSFLQIKRDWSNLDTEYFSAESELMSGLTEDAQQSLPSGLPVLPIGFGVRYYLSDKIGISAETTYRLASADYLDGFSRAANPTKSDHYYSHIVGVVYRLGRKNMLDCPVIRY
jgi:Outer membrane protein beta-barrel domain